MATDTFLLQDEKIVYLKFWLQEWIVYIRDQTARFVQSDLNLHYHQQLLVSSIVRKELIVNPLNVERYKKGWNIHGGESLDTTTTTMTDIWKKSLTSGKKIFNNSVYTWPIGIWFEAEKAEGLQGFAWCVRFFKQHLIKKLLTSKQIFYPG